ncbi:macrophage mannose receptor 1-like [Hoplias malabaricus]|uniref:macrophage mannose receptor 1-like n=1 Tax=Hoplias malabaricus TaxID=27720 RepID=UPI0034627873
MVSVDVCLLFFFMVFLDGHSKVSCNCNSSSSQDQSGKIYHLVNDTKNWTDAKSYCMNNYKDLAIIYDQRDWGEALAAVRSSANEVWIGLHNETQWMWSNGENATFFHWEPSYENKSGYDCVSSFSGKWRSDNCLLKQSYMCQIVTNTSGIMKKTFVYKNMSTMWDGAYNACTNISGDLAVITTMDEQNMFINTAPNNTSVWIGLRRNIWRWSSGKLPKCIPGDDPNNRKSCIKIKDKIYLTPDNCSTSSMFLCYSVTTNGTAQFTNSNVNATVPPPTSSTFKGTHSYNLTFINQTKNWTEALQYCWKNHKTLVHIVNDTVQDYVVQMLQNEVYPNGVWIGLERNMMFMCAPWLWTGGPYVHFSNWSSTFPVDPISQFCGKIIGNKTNWLDAYCGEELPFICQSKKIKQLLISIATTY